MCIHTKALQCLVGFVIALAGYASDLGESGFKLYVSDLPFVCLQLNFKNYNFCSLYVFPSFR